MKTRSWALALVALLTSSDVVVPASALECPVPQPLARPGVLKETPAEIDNAGGMLSSADAGDDHRSQEPISESRERRNRELHHHGLLPGDRPNGGAQRGGEEGEDGSVRPSAHAKDLLAGQSRAFAMEALLGFQLDFWDYATFAALFVTVLAGLGLAVFVLGLPGRIAIASNHTEAD